nr:MAG TPA: hypothetical protein [Caudoviricetes sp.]
MVKEIRVCDGCGKELKSGMDTYHLGFDSEIYKNDAGELAKNIIYIELCKACCLSVVDSLHKIAENTSK